MVNVLYVYGAVAFIAVWAACYSLGGQRARLVLTGGLYRLHPGYRPRRGPNRLVRGHADHRQRDSRFNPLSWESGLCAQLYADAGYDAEAVTAVLPALAEPTAARPESLIVRADIDPETAGAEHWGDLLDAMNTEEREIYNLEMVLLHEAAMPIQREAFAGLDEVVAQFEAQLDRALDVEVRRYNHAMDRLLAERGGAQRWATGQYRLYEPAYAAA